MLKFSVNPGERIPESGVCSFSLPFRCLFWRLSPVLSALSCPRTGFSAPLPRRGRIDPRPALEERSSHAGEGGDFKFILPGAVAPGTPALRRERHGVPDSLRYPKTHAGSGTGSRYLSGYRGRHPFATKKFPLSTGKGAAKESGGTGGGELRRLRWSPPPGRGKDMLPGDGGKQIRQRLGRAGNAGYRHPKTIEAARLTRAAPVQSTAESVQSVPNHDTDEKYYKQSADFSAV